MDRASLRKQVHWILLHYGMRAFLEETIEELGDSDEEYIKELRDNLKTTLKEYEKRYDK